MDAMRAILRKGLWAAGVKVYTKESLPTGNVIAKDVSLDTPPDAIRTVLDVGANVGQAALSLRETFPQAVIHSFEPVPEAYADLLRAVGGDPRIRTYPLALGNTASRARIHLQARSRFNSLAPHLNRPDPSRGGESVEVEVTTIDRFCLENGIGEVDYLKVDAEGLDLDVLRGAAAMFEGGKIRYVMVEVAFNPDLEPRYTPFDAVDGFLKERGLRLRAIYHQASNEKPYLSYADALYLRQPVKR
jgi:FkbM family methyltransferase